MGRPKDNSQKFSFRKWLKWRWVFEEINGSKLCVKANARSHHCVMFIMRNELNGRNTETHEDDCLLWFDLNINLFRSSYSSRAVLRKLLRYVIMKWCSAAITECLYHKNHSTKWITFKFHLLFPACFSYNISNIKYVPSRSRTSRTMKSREDRCLNSLVQHSQMHNLYYSSYASSHFYCIVYILNYSWMNLGKFNSWQ